MPITRARSLRSPLQPPALIALCAVLITMAVPALRVGAQSDTSVPVVTSAPGQIKVVTINSKQRKVLGLRRFEQLSELAAALRSRPPAFNGGAELAVDAPDVLIAQELSAANLEILAQVLKERFGSRYVVAGEDAAADFVINTDAVTLQGNTETWPDVCYVAPEATTTPSPTASPSPTGGPTAPLLEVTQAPSLESSPSPVPSPSPSATPETRFYQYGRFIENETGAPFVVAGIHLTKNYDGRGQDCFSRNVAELRRQLAAETAPVIAGGDFNRRPVAIEHECDEDERSAPAEWWLGMTAPTDGGRAYSDAVLTSHRAQGLSLADEWTQEQKSQREVCDGSTRFRRTRIDYLFTAGAIVADAHVDHPGWAEAQPGDLNPANYKYSDHRFVWGRFVIAGPPQPLPPTATAAVGGLIQVSWPQVQGAAGLVLLRAADEGAYEVIEQLTPETITYEDQATRHDVEYSYAIAGVDPTGAQGLESPPATVIADKRGPIVVKTSPAAGQTDVRRGKSVRVRFDDVYERLSAGRRTIRLFTGGEPVRGGTERSSTRSLTFRPSNKLEPGRKYRVVVEAVADALGNEGRRARWTFTTAGTPRTRTPDEEPKQPSPAPSGR